MASYMFPIGRLINNAVLKNRGFNLKPISRNSGHVYNYRCAPPPANKYVVLGGDLAGGFMWWWVLWHLWHDYEHITGEFPYPDTSKWTDEELGIPSD